MKKLAAGLVVALIVLAGCSSGYGNGGSSGGGLYYDYDSSAPTYASATNSDNEIL